MATFASILTATLLLATGPSLLSQPGVQEVEAAVSVQRQQSQPYSLIQQLRPDTWQVDQTLVDIYTTDLQAAGVLAMATLHRDAFGAVDGFVLLQVVDGSPLHQAGFRTGDVVHSVEDKPVGGPVRALLVMRELRHAQAVDVQLSRAGKRLEQHYVVPR